MAEHFKLKFFGIGWWSQLENILLPQNIWQCQQAFLIVTSGGLSLGAGVEDGEGAGARGVCWHLADRSQRCS